MDSKHRINRPIWHCWRLIAITLLALASLPGQGAAAPSSGPAQLVKAIPSSTGDSSLGQLTAVGQRIYFFPGTHSFPATNSIVLWTSDGTPTGTLQLAELVISGRLLTNVDDTLFFVKDTELWKTNGTLSGTSLVKQFKPGPNIFQFGNFFTLRGFLFFEVSENNSLSLWKSDGTLAGTQRVALSWPGVVSSPIVVDDTIFFISPNSVASGTFDLWKSDGTAAGTRPVFQQIPPLPFPSTSARSPNPSLGEPPEPPPPPPIPLAQFVNMDGTLFFSLEYNFSTYGLWRSDGTTAGTSRVKDISPLLMTVVGKVLFFSVSGYGSGGEPAHGSELWKSDGTTAGTMLVKDIAPGADSSEPCALTELNGTLFFMARNAIGRYNLWKSNGTAAGTVPVTDFDAGVATQLMRVNGKLFFSADDELHGAELWKSDGTTAGTVLVKDIYSGAGGADPNWLVNANGTLFFAARDHDHGMELWRSDGTAAGTALVKDMNADPGGDFSFQRLADLNGMLFFWRANGNHEMKLWQTDGTPSGTTMVKDLKEAPGFHNPPPEYSQAISLDNALFFQINGQLWRSDGTWTGTAPFANGSYYQVYRMLNVNGTLFFFFDQGLWRSDGTPAGTTLVKAVAPSSDLYNMVEVNGNIFFVAFGNELWKSDGTAAGTTKVRGSSSGFSQMTAVGDTLFFQGSDGTHGFELWKSDGTATGTTMVRDIFPGPNNSFPSKLTSLNGNLLFVANGGQLGAELWRSNGTTGGTVRVADITPGPASSSFGELVSVGGTLFFTRFRESGQPGWELWKSDGTTEGTTLAAPLPPGPMAWAPAELFAFNGQLLFTAVTATGYRALWRSDGTAQGTRPIQEIMPERQPYTPIYPTVSGSSIYFNAYTSAATRELWFIPMSAGVDASVSAPTLARGAVGGEVGIPIAYLNAGRTVAQGTTVSATLDPRLAYVGDTSGIVPTVSGTTLTWRLPDAGLLDGRDFRLRVRLPQAPLGTRYPITLRVTTAATDARPANNTVIADVVAADLHYLPIARR